MGVIVSVHAAIVCVSILFYIWMYGSFLGFLKIIKKTLIIDFTNIDEGESGRLRTRQRSWELGVTE